VYTYKRDHIVRRAVYYKVLDFAVVCKKLFILTHTSSVNLAYDVSLLSYMKEYDYV
jgi:hypothetical protein